jgi:hypothetical protein
MKPQRVQYSSKKITANARHTYPMSFTFFIS